MTQKIDLSIIILNYNTQDLLRDCLKSLQKSDIGEYKIEIIVVDNASPDQSVAMVRREFPENMLIANSQNLGFSAGNNVALPYSSGRYVLFLNPDTLVPPQTLKAMLEFMDKTKVAAATCRVELKDGSLDDSCHRGFPTPWNSLCHFIGLEKLFPRSAIFAGYSLGNRISDSNPHYIDACNGAFLLVRREAGESINWWNEKYYWYGEDLDFCYRLSLAGGKIYYVPNFKIIHYKGASSGMLKHSQKVTTASKETKIRSAKASTQAMRIFYNQHYRQKYSFLTYWLVLRAIDLLEKIRLYRLK